MNVVERVPYSLVQSKTGKQPSKVKWVGTPKSSRIFGPRSVVLDKGKHGNSSEIVMMHQQSVLSRSMQRREICRAAARDVERRIS